MRVVVIGCGVAGLSAGIGLARSGHRVTILERDPAPGNMDVEAAFVGWRRNGVPQIRQGHFILGRAKDMLDRHAPGVVAALAGEGIVPASNPMLVALSPEQLLPGDELTPIPTRRIPFELTMRRVAEAEDGIEIRSAVKVLGLSVTNQAGLPRVRGVGLSDGTSIEADFVVDAGGRRSPVTGGCASTGPHCPPSRRRTAASPTTAATSSQRVPHRIRGSFSARRARPTTSPMSFSPAIVAPTAWCSLRRRGIASFTLRDVRAWNAAASSSPRA